MAVKTAHVTVGTTATLLTAMADSESASPGQSVMLHNLGTAAVYVGGADATLPATPATAGAELAAGDRMLVDVPQNSQLYGIVAAGTCVVSVMQVGV